MKIHLLMSGVSLAALALTATSAAAQGVASEGATLGEVIVTGTRAQGVKAEDSAAPVQVVGVAALQRTGNVDLLNSMASNVPSLNVLKGGNDSAALAFQGALRGVNPNNTLILVNGKRRHTTANLGVLGGNPYSGAAAADLSLIPAGAISRVEVLTDGAAAQYGSDAIAGVINIILKKADGGGSASAGIGQYYEGDGQDGHWTINKGFSIGERGFLNVTLEQHYHETSIRGGPDRRYLTPDGTLLPNLNPVDAAGVPNAENFPVVNQFNGDPQYNLYNVFLNGAYDLGQGVEAYAYGSYSNRNAARYGQYRPPSRISGVPMGSTTRVYPISAGFSPIQKFDETDYAVTGGLRGETGGWTWDVASAYGGNIDKIYTNNTANADLFALLQSQSATLLAPQRDFYDGAFKATEWTNTIDVSRSFEVGLASPLNVAAGAEYRRNTYEIKAGELASYYLGGAQAFVGFTPGDAAEHSRHNVSAYLDLAVDPIENLHVDIAGRLEHYSDFGDARIYKLTSRYDFNDAIAIRGTISTGFRAPTLAEEYYSGTNVGPTSINVQLPPNSPAATLAGFGPLKPEKSKNYSVGFVLHPLPGLQITADAYRLDIRDRIIVSGLLYGSQAGVGVTSQPILDAIAARGVLVDPGLALVGASIFANAAETSTTGVEITANYVTDLDDYGIIDWSAGINFNKTDIKSLAPLPAEATNTAISQTAYLSAQARSALVDATPKAKAVLQANWRKGKLSTTLRTTIYGPVSESLSLNLSGSGPGAYTGKVDTTPIFDLSVNYKVTPQITLTAGADNIFDKVGARVPTVTDSAGVVRPADGTAVFDLPYKFAPWGINGGYYYTRIAVAF